MICDRAEAGEGGKDSTVTFVPPELPWEASQRDIQCPPYNLSLAMLSQTPAPVSLVISWQQSSERLRALLGSRTRFVWLLISAPFFKLCYFN